MCVLAVLTGVNFHSEGELVVFCSVLLGPNQVCIVRPRHQHKWRSHSKDSYLLYKAGFGILVCHTWLRKLEKIQGRVVVVKRRRTSEYSLTFLSHLIIPSHGLLG